MYVGRRRETEASGWGGHDTTKNPSLRGLSLLFHSAPFRFFIESSPRASTTRSFPGGVPHPAHGTIPPFGQHRVHPPLRVPKALNACTCIFTCIFGGENEPRTHHTRGARANHDDDAQTKRDGTSIMEARVPHSYCPPPPHLHAQPRVLNPIHTPTDARFFHSLSSARPARAPSHPVIK